MLGAILGFPKKFINKILNGIELKRKRATYSKDIRINGHLRLHGHGKIIIGQNVRINSSYSSNPIGGMTYASFSVKDSATLTIGNHVGISNSTIICQNAVTIEDNVLIGGSVKIYDTDFHSLDYTCRGHGADVDIPVTKPVLIKKNAFVGAHSIILKGVTIGECAIIGAGSVVTKNVGNNEVWAGNPAKFIKRLD